MCEVESNKLVVCILTHTLCNSHIRSDIPLFRYYIHLDLYLHTSTYRCFLYWHIYTSMYLHIWRKDVHDLRLSGDEVNWGSPWLTRCKLLRFDRLRFRKRGAGKKEECNICKRLSGHVCAKTLYTSTLIHMDTQTNANVSCRSFGPCLGQGSRHCWGKHGPNGWNCAVPCFSSGRISRFSLGRRIPYFTRASASVVLTCLHFMQRMPTFTNRITFSNIYTTQHRALHMRLLFFSYAYNLRRLHF